MDFITLTHCPVCGKNDFAHLPEPGHWIGNGLFDSLKGKIGLMKCRGCSLVFTNPRPSQAALNTFYSGDTYVCHNPSESSTAVARARFLLDKMDEAALPGAPRTMLDFGCGGGGFIRFAQQRNWDARGFEPGRRGLNVCKQAGLDVTDDLESLPKNFFGMVTLHHVFEHLDDHRAVLDQIRKYVAPGGQLFIEVPNVDSLRARLSLPLLSKTMNFDERYRAFPIHLSYFNEKSLTLLLPDAGWKVERVFTVGLGIEELVKQDDVEAPPAQEKAPAPAPVVSAASQPASSSPLRRALKGLIYGGGMGESLCVIAQPVAN